MTQRLLAYNGGIRAGRYSRAMMRLMTLCEYALPGQRFGIASHDRFISAVKLTDGRLSFTSERYADIEERQARGEGEIQRLLRMFGVEDEIIPEFPGEQMQ